MLGQRAMQVTQVEQPELLALVEQPLEPPVREPRREVEDGPLRRRDRHAAQLGPFVLAQGARAVPAHPAEVLAGVRRRDLDQTLGGRRERPGDGGRHVTEHRVLAACEQRRPPASLDARHRVSDREHAAMRDVQPAPPEPVVERLRADALPQQLFARDASRLLARERCDHMIRADFALHVEA